MIKKKIKINKAGFGRLKITYKSTYDKWKLKDVWPFLDNGSQYIDAPVTIMAGLLNYDKCTNMSVTFKMWPLTTMEEEMEKWGIDPVPDPPPDKWQDVENVTYVNNTYITQPVTEKTVTIYINGEPTEIPIPGGADVKDVCESIVVDVIDPGSPGSNAIIDVYGQNPTDVKTDFKDIIVDIQDAGQINIKESITFNKGFADLQKPIGNTSNFVVVLKTAAVVSGLQYLATEGSSSLICPNFISDSKYTTMSADIDYFTQKYTISIPIPTNWASETTEIIIMFSSCGDKAVTLAIEEAKDTSPKDIEINLRLQLEGDEVSGTKVELQYNQIGIWQQVGFTDSNGNITLYQVPVGKHGIRFTGNTDIHKDSNLDDITTNDVLVVG